MTLIFRTLITLCAFAAIAGARAADQAQFEPAVSTLTGRILSEYVMVPGREMSKGVALWLDPAITIEGNPDSRKNKRSLRDVRKILLKAASPDLDLAAYAGQTVNVEGLLFREYADIYHTDVTMQVSRVAAQDADSDPFGD